MDKRFERNPILTTKDLIPSRQDWTIECVMNPGVFSFQDKTWLAIRVAERPQQKAGFISLPVYTADGDLKIIEFQEGNPEWDTTDPRKFNHGNEVYLSTISHLRLMCSDDGVNFYKPESIPDIIKSYGKYETFGIEDCRVTFLEGKYHLTYTQVSELGVGVGLMKTSDWKDFERHDMIFMPHNKDCALFEEKINNLYFSLNRPSGIGLGGNYMWISSSTDLIHWGNHQCLIKTRPGMWDSSRVGAGTSPIKTDQGWLEIYHGADENDRYCLGALLLDLNDPSKVLARSEKPLIEPTAIYETTGFYNNVIFTNGHIVEGDKITMYYGASDEVICGAIFSIRGILDELLQ